MLVDDTLDLISFLRTYFKNLLNCYRGLTLLINVLLQLKTFSSSIIAVVIIGTNDSLGNSLGFRGGRFLLPEYLGDQIWSGVPFPFHPSSI